MTLLVYINTNITYYMMAYMHTHTLYVTKRKDRAVEREGEAIARLCLVPRAQLSSSSPYMY